MNLWNGSIAGEIYCLVVVFVSASEYGDFIGERDKAIFLFLLNTGARARELCNLNIKEIDLNTGSAMICYGKGGKTRMVLIGRKSGVHIFVLQRLMGYADLQVLRRYLAQNEEDNQLAYMRGAC